MNIVDNGTSTLEFFHYVAFLICQQVVVYPVDCVSLIRMTVFLDYDDHAYDKRDHVPDTLS